MEKVLNPRDRASLFADELFTKPSIHRPFHDGVSLFGVTFAMHVEHHPICRMTDGSWSDEFTSHFKNLVQLRVRSAYDYAQMVSGQKLSLPADCYAEHATEATVYTDRNSFVSIIYVDGKRGSIIPIGYVVWKITGHFQIAITDKMIVAGFESEYKCLGATIDKLFEYECFHIQQCFANKTEAIMRRLTKQKSALTMDMCTSHSILKQILRSLIGKKTYANTERLEWEWDILTSLIRRIRLSPDKLTFTNN